jgi:hypothetical protein
MSEAPTNIETAVRRTLAALIGEAFPSVTVARTLISAPPEENRFTVLPGQAAATAVEPFIGDVEGRVWRDEEFSVRVWVEVIGNDLDDVEDQVDEFVAGLEDIVVTNPDLGGMAGVISFGEQMSRDVHPVWEPQPGFFYLWVDTEISVKARYD